MFAFSIIVVVLLLTVFSVTCTLFVIPPVLRWISEACCITPPYKGSDVERKSCPVE